MMRTRTHIGGLTAAALLLVTATACGDDAVRDKAGAADATSSAATVSPAARVTGAPASQVDMLVQSGIEQAQGGDLNRASYTFANALVLDPENKYAMYNLGLIAQTSNDIERAGLYYNKALVVDPRYTPALYNKAISLEQTDLDKSVELYEKILRIDPQAATTYLRLGFAYATQGLTQEAAEARRQAIALDPTLAQITAP